MRGRVAAWARGANGMVLSLVERCAHLRKSPEFLEGLLLRFLGNLKIVGLL